MAGGGNHRAQRAQIERIVREVLAELTQTQTGAGLSNGELIVSTKVVSTRELEGRLGGVVRLIVSRGTVITPAARDLLNEQKIAVASAVEARMTSGDTQLVLGVAETRYELTPLLQLLSRQNVNVKRLPENTLIETIDAVCERVAAGSTLGLVLTGQTSAALCLANRRNNVRAALATGSEAVSNAMNSLAANVLIVDPAGTMAFHWKRLLTAWLQAGLQDCPTALRERLG
jgi:ribose 5-phosphate isomerase RpiB